LNESEATLVSQREFRLRPLRQPSISAPPRFIVAAIASTTTILATTITLKVKHLTGASVP
jgi:hypothetical protein